MHSVLYIYVYMHRACVLCITPSETYGAATSKGKRTIYFYIPYIECLCVQIYVAIS